MGSVSNIFQDVKDLLLNTTVGAHLLQNRSHRNRSGSQQVCTVGVIFSSRYEQKANKYFY